MKKLTKREREIIDKANRDFCGLDDEYVYDKTFNYWRPVVKKQTVDSISKQIFADQLEREQSDKLSLLFAKGLVLFVVGYMAYHFIRFLMM